MKKTKILIVDDHRVVIEGIKSSLTQDPKFHIVGEALHGREAVEKVKTLRPDIIIMDISMPDLNGIDATLQIKKIDPEIKIIIFTMYSDEEYVVDLLTAGISAYILKEDPVSDLILAIEEVMKGRSYFSKTAPKIIIDRLKTTRDGENQKDRFKDLSLRERQVLQLLAEGNSIKDTATKLDLSPKTVETHKYNIMDKLNAANMSELTRIAIRKKLIKA
jgi:two-component system, NarL family, response regulator NreC